MFVPGVKWDFGNNLAPDRRIGFDGIYAAYLNRWPPSPGLPERACMYLSRLLRGVPLGVGGGWHGVSNHQGDLGAGLFFWIDPLTVDITIPYDDRNRSQLFFADAEFAGDRLDLILRYGYGIATPINVYSHEVNVLAFYSLSESVRLAGLVSANRYSGSFLSHYTRIGATITLVL